MKEKDWSDLKIFDPLKVKDQIDMTTEQEYKIFCAMHSLDGMGSVIKQIKKALNIKREANPNRFNKLFPGVGD